jgi:hypothetical protein
MAKENGYEVKITQAGGTEIYLDSAAIQSVRFEIDTINDNVKDRSEDVVNHVIVTGKISKENKEATKDLLLWSLAKVSEEVYRTAEISIKINQTERVRKYTLDKVFCLDYNEQFNNGDADNAFELKFAQRKDNLDGISVIC